MRDKTKIVTRYPPLFDVDPIIPIVPYPIKADPLVLVRYFSFPIRNHVIFSSSGCPGFILICIAKQ
jgi:hypothetical protein